LRAIVPADAGEYPNAKHCKDKESGHVPAAELLLLGRGRRACFFNISLLHRCEWFRCRLTAARGAQRFKILIGNFPLFPREGIPAQQRHELRHELRSSKLRCGIDQMVLLLAHIGALKDKARQLFVPLQFVQEI